jgi:hypothetical protein
VASDYPELCRLCRIPEAKWTTNLNEFNVLVSAYAGGSGKTLAALTDAIAACKRTNKQMATLRRAEVREFIKRAGRLSTARTASYNYSRMVEKLINLGIDALEERAARRDTKEDSTATKGSNVVKAPHKPANGKARKAAAR